MKLQVYNVKRRPDPAWFYIGIVAVVAIAAVLFMLTSGGSLFSGLGGDRVGLATESGSGGGGGGVSVPPYVEGEGWFNVGEPTEIELEDGVHTLTLTAVLEVDTSNSNVANLTFDGTEYTFVEGAGALVAGKTYLQLETVDFDRAYFYFYDRWYAPTCDGIGAAQTVTSGENMACCDGVMTELPKCRQDGTKPTAPTPVECGDRVITCDGGQMVMAPLIEEKDGSKEEEK